jgi:hypothetical protein
MTSTANTPIGSPPRPSPLPKKNIRATPPQKITNLGNAASTFSPPAPDPTASLTNPQPCRCRQPKLAPQIRRGLSSTYLLHIVSCGLSESLRLLHRLDSSHLPPRQRRCLRSQIMSRNPGRTVFIGEISSPPVPLLFERPLSRG